MADSPEASMAAARQRYLMMRGNATDLDGSTKTFLFNELLRSSSEEDHGQRDEEIRRKLQRLGDMFDAYDENKWLAQLAKDNAEFPDSMEEKYPGFTHWKDLDFLSNPKIYNEFMNYPPEYIKSMLKQYKAFQYKFELIKDFETTYGVEKGRAYLKRFAGWTLTDGPKIHEMMRDSSKFDIEKQKIAIKKKLLAKKEDILIYANPDEPNISTGPLAEAAQEIDSYLDEQNLNKLFNPIIDEKMKVAGNMIKEQQKKIKAQFLLGNQPAYRILFPYDPAGKGELGGASNEGTVEIETMPSSYQRGLIDAIQSNYGYTQELATDIVMSGRLNNAVNAEMNSIEHLPKNMPFICNYGFNFNGLHDDEKREELKSFGMDVTSHPAVARLIRETEAQFNDPKYKKQGTESKDGRVTPKILIKGEKWQRTKELYKNNPSGIIINPTEEGTLGKIAFPYAGKGGMFSYGTIGTVVAAATNSEPGSGERAWDSAFSSGPIEPTSQATADAPTAQGSFSELDKINKLTEEAAKAQAAKTAEKDKINAEIQNIEKEIGSAGDGLRQQNAAEEKQTHTVELEEDPTAFYEKIAQGFIARDSLPDSITPLPLPGEDPQTAALRFLSKHGLKITLSGGASYYPIGAPSPEKVLYSNPHRYAKVSDDFNNPAVDGMGRPVFIKGKDSNHLYTLDIGFASNDIKDITSEIAAPFAKMFGKDMPDLTGVFNSAFKKYHALAQTGPSKEMIAEYEKINPNFVQAIRAEHIKAVEAFSNVEKPDKTALDKFNKSILDKLENAGIDPNYASGYVTAMIDYTRPPLSKKAPIGGSTQKPRASLDENELRELIEKAVDMSEDGLPKLLDSDNILKDTYARFSSIINEDPKAKESYAKLLEHKRAMDSDIPAEQQIPANENFVNAKKTYEERFKNLHSLVGPQPTSEEPPAGSILTGGVQPPPIGKKPPEGDEKSEEGNDTSTPP